MPTPPPPKPVHDPPPSAFDSNDTDPTSVQFGDSISHIDQWGAADLPLLPIPVDTHWMLAAEACNSWTESSAVSPTVSIGRLAVPGKASGEYQKGCGALKDKKYDEAEKHERSAIQLYPDYAAAWVVLGQTLESENKRDDGEKACSQARAVDPNYVAPYLCLADLAASQENWKEVSTLSASALTLDPTGNAYSFYYAADAAFHLGDLPKAEKDAQNSVKLDKWRHLAQVHLLLAQIDKMKGDSAGQAAQLHEYLKIAGNSPEASGVKGTLTHIENKPSQ